METNPMPLIMSVPKAIQEAPIQSWTWMICDESGILEQIELTHYPDGREINVQSVLSIINNVLKDCVINPSTEDLEDGAECVDELVQHEIQRLSPQLAYLGSEVDVHAKTVDVFNMLSNYPWEAKLALALAALVADYGEYWVAAQASSEEELTKTMKFLRQMGETPALHETKLFDVLHRLIDSMLDMIKSIVRIKEFMLSADETTISIATTIIVIASYWTVRSIVTSAPYIHSLFASGSGPSASKQRELGIMTRKIRTLLECLQNHEENTCSKKVQRALETDNADNMEKHYRAMQRSFDADHADNMWIFNLLFNSKGEDLTQIFDCSTNQRVKLETFKNQFVVLMISSGINVPKEVLHWLAQIWRNKQDGDGKHEMIWFPIVEQSVQWTESMQQKFGELRSKMPCYSVNDPRSIDPTAIKTVKEKFHFKKQTILAVMDPVGKIVHHNAIHMLWTWGVDAFPLTVEREAFLCRNRFPTTIAPHHVLSRFHAFLVKGIDEKTDKWIVEEPMFLIGGDDMEWVQRFASMVNACKKSHGFNPRIVYIGKGTTCRERAGKITWGITEDTERRHCWEDDDEDHSKVWFFWTRVQSMLLCRIHFLRNSSLDENQDRAAKELKKLLSYDKNCQVWAIFSTDVDFCVIEDGQILLKAFLEFDRLTTTSTKYPRTEAVEERCTKLQAASPSHAYGCSRLEFPSETPLESVKCHECSRSMEKRNALICCHHDQQGS